MGVMESASVKWDSYKVGYLQNKGCTNWGVCE